MTLQRKTQKSNKNIFSGLIIQLAGWEWVFYLQGGLALIWCLLWTIFVADTPTSHRWPWPLFIQTLELVCSSVSWSVGHKKKKIHHFSDFGYLAGPFFFHIHNKVQPNSNYGLRFISSAEAEYIAASQPKQVISSCFRIGQNKFFFVFRGTLMQASLRCPGERFSAQVLWKWKYTTQAPWTGWI